MPKDATPDWALIEELYRSRDLTLTEIAHRCGVTTQAIGRKARAGGWPPRRGKSVAAARAGALTLKERLINAMEKKLRHIEERLETGSPKTVTASERDTRELGTVARHLERMGAVEPQPAGAEPTSPTRIGTTEEDAERWRHEIAERLEKIAERLERGGGAQGGGV
jgi:hypothetical protein